MVDDGPPTKAEVGKGEVLKPIAGPITIEQAFKVDGKKLTVQVTFPGTLGPEVKMDDVVIVANRALITIESKNHKVDKIRGGS